MSILVVGNILKDVYLNLDSSKNRFEVDKNDTKWLDFNFNAGSNYYFSRNSSLGGAAVSLEVFKKMGLEASIAGSNLKYSDGELVDPDHSDKAHRYILISDSKASYLVPSKEKTTDFVSPAEAIDYLYVDRSANLSLEAIKKINTYLDLAQKTRLILYLNTSNIFNLKPLISRADLFVLEENGDESEKTYALELNTVDPNKIIRISENRLSYLNIVEGISPTRVDISTHLSLYSIAAATILGGFILGNSVEESLKMARVNVENSKLDDVLDLAKLKDNASNLAPTDNLELIAASLLQPKKGILAADESGGSIKKKFAKLNIPDTYDNRRDYRNIFFTTEDLEKYVNGVILFDETARQFADNGQNFVDFLIARRIIPGIKVDQGLETFPDSLETFTKGLEGLSERLKEYYSLGLRFAKWRAAFEIHISDSGEILTPTEGAIEENCRILSEYAKECQNANIVPIVEPEVVYDGYYPIEKSAEVTGRILDRLFEKLRESGVNLKGCILKVNMVLAGKQFETQSTPEEVGQKTAKVLKAHVPEDLAGVVFLSGGQTVEQATDNLSEVEKNGPFPWPVTFSFARALQDPALYAWAGDNNNANTAREAFKARLIANTEVLP
ncbi:fructose-bisphosphate aldolase class I [Candidatus Saccharibacteria bacterium]|nr:fructose-bisphosphate aldolase class I [Candidatus Saccharibacteria bacterium]